jgi:hypothetical protein
MYLYVDSNVAIACLKDGNMLGLRVDDVVETFSVNLEVDRKVDIAHDRNNGRFETRFSGLEFPRGLLHYGRPEVLNNAHGVDSFVTACNLQFSLV